MADEGRLEYTLNMSTDGTVLMRAFIREKAEKQYFLELKDYNDEYFSFTKGKKTHHKLICHIDVIDARRK